MLPVVIYGNGSMARVIHSYARHVVNVVGFTVDEACIAEGVEVFCKLPLIPFSRVCGVFPPRDHKLLMAVGFLEMNALRERKSEEAKAKGYNLTGYVDPTLRRHDDVEIDETSVILDHVSIHPGSRIRSGVFISSNASIGHDCLVETHAWVNSGVSVGGGCRIGRGSFLGVNASVSHGVNLGARTFLAANTLIAHDTEDESVYLSEGAVKFRLRSPAFLKFARI